MAMDGEELKGGTKQFALRVIKLTRALPRTSEARVIGNQLLRCGTAVGANYRAVCLARSTPDFIAKWQSCWKNQMNLCTGSKLLVEAGIVKQQRLADLLAEARELAAIFAASKITAGKNMRTASASHF